MFDSKMFAMLIQVILIIAALNWGLVAYNGTDLVKIVTGGGEIEKYAKFAVAAVGLLAVYNLFM
jgi:uncharacterized membrane protein YuzA (DUF378 family)